MPSNRKVLILGCNHLQIPYIKEARKLGFFVIGCDRNPHAPGREFVDRFYCVGYDDFQNLLKIAEQESLTAEDRLFTAASHFAYEGLGYVAESTNIPFPSRQNIDICLDKIKFYELLKQYQLQFPHTQIFHKNRPPEINPEKTYYLKSDYGKSPNYCYLVKDGNFPDLPDKFDNFYRHYFLIQEAVVGDHYRLNLYRDQVACFLNYGTNHFLPLHLPGIHAQEFIYQLQKLQCDLHLSNFIIKIDYIVSSKGCFVLDIGLDPPMRLR
ncbi:MAG: hypothetical protein D6813_08655, partial [Calditrichaeota bacterium]